MRWKLRGFVTGWVTGWVTRGLWRMGVREASGALRPGVLHGLHQR